MLRPLVFKLKPGFQKSQLPLPLRVPRKQIAETPDTYISRAGKRMYGDPRLAATEVSSDTTVPMVVPKAAPLSDYLHGAASDDFHERVDSEGSKVISHFLRSPQSPPHWPVVPAQKLKRVWGDYAKYGFVRNEKALNEIKDHVLNGIARLHFSTGVQGHTEHEPHDFIERAGYDFDDDQKDALADHLVDEEGNWMLSDYGTPKLQKLYPHIHASTGSDLLYHLDRALNVVHQRSDLAKMFVEGGSGTLSEIAGDNDQTRKSLEGHLREESLRKSTLPASYEKPGGLPQYEGDLYPKLQQLRDLYNQYPNLGSYDSPESNHQSGLHFLQAAASVFKQENPTIWELIDRTLATKSRNKREIARVATYTGNHVIGALHKQESTHKNFVRSLLRYAQMMAPHEALNRTQKLNSSVSGWLADHDHLTKNPRAIFHHVMESELPDMAKFQIAQGLGLSMHDIMEMRENPIFPGSAAQSEEVVKSVLSPTSASVSAALPAQPLGHSQPLPVGSYWITPEGHTLSAQSHRGNHHEDFLLAHRDHPAISPHLTPLMQQEDDSRKWEKDALDRFGRSSGWIRHGVYKNDLGIYYVLPSDHPRDIGRAQSHFQSAFGAHAPAQALLGKGKVGVLVPRENGGFPLIWNTTGSDDWNREYRQDKRAGIAKSKRSSSFQGENPNELRSASK